MHQNNASERLHYLKAEIENIDRVKVVEYLENQAGMQCYDDEPVQELRQVLFNCVLEGDVVITDL